MLETFSALSTTLLICAIFFVVLAGKRKRTSRKVSVFYFPSGWVFPGFGAELRLSICPNNSVTPLLSLLGSSGALPAQEEGKVHTKSAGFSLSAF